VRPARSCVPWLVVAIVFASAGVRAQSPRPFSGLFGGGEGGDSGTRTQSLDLTVSGYGGYEGNVALAQSNLFGGGVPPIVSTPPGESNPVPTAGSSMYGATATMDYSHRWKRASLGTFGSVTSSRYNSINDAVSTGYSAGLGFHMPLARRTSLQVNTTVRWMPYYELGSVFPPLPTVGDVNVPVAAPSFELGLVPATALHMNSDVRLSRNLSRHSHLDFSYKRSATQFGESSYSTFNTSDTSAGVEFNQVLSKNMSLRLGYAYRIGQLGNLPEQRYHSHEINAGVDYHRAFNLWRRTTFSFSTGSTVFANQPLHTLRPPIGPVTSPVTSTGHTTESLLAADDGSATDIRVILTGTGSLVWEFLRSWAARVMVNRGVNYLEGFAAPAVTNSLSTGIGGLVSRRVGIDAGASYSTGTVGATKGLNNGYGSWNAFASADYAMTQHLALYARYFYYDYGFQSGVALPPGLSNQFQRNGARFGVKAWVPLCKCR
jgi:opacity protein-like surface antigen